MESTKKQGLILILFGILIGISYQLLHFAIPFLSITLIEFIGAIFNMTLMGLATYFILKDEFLDWFKHFSFKWLLIGIPLLFMVGIIVGNIWTFISGVHIENSVNTVLSWSYVLIYVPFMLLGEELLSIGILYAAWKKLNWNFWYASLFVSILFALWHLPSYDFNILQCLVTIIPSRLILNYLFRKSNSIWVTFLVHFSFDFLSFLPILLSIQ